MVSTSLVRNLFDAGTSVQAVRDGGGHVRVERDHATVALTPDNEPLGTAEKVAPVSTAPTEDVTRHDPIAPIAVRPCADHLPRSLAADMTHLDHLAAVGVRAHACRAARPGRRDEWGEHGEDR